MAKRGTPGERVYAQYLSLDDAEKDKVAGLLFKNDSRFIEILQYRTYFLNALGELSRHRKKKVNSQRDAEILKLRSEGKTAGQIVLALKKVFPDLTPNIVHRVTYSHRTRQQRLNKMANATKANVAPQ